MYLEALDVGYHGTESNAGLQDARRWSDADAAEGSSK
jgi:hypothetical protein